MTDAEHGERKSAQQELLLWMRKRYAAAALEAAMDCLRSRGNNAEEVRLLHGRLREGGYEAVVLPRDGMTLLCVSFDEQEGDAMKETVEVYALVSSTERTVEL